MKNNILFIVLVLFFFASCSQREKYVINIYSTREMGSGNNITIDTITNSDTILVNDQNNARDLACLKYWTKRVVAAKYDNTPPIGFHLYHSNGKPIPINEYLISESTQAMIDKLRNEFEHYQYKNKKGHTIYK